MITHIHKPLSCWLLLALAACGGSSGGPALTPEGPIDPLEPVARKINPDDARLQPGLSCQAYRDYLTEAFVEKYITANTVCIECPIAVTTGDAGAINIPDAVSDTNIQESGVGESDIVKADSSGNLFIADNKRIQIVDAFEPQNMTVLATLPFDKYIQNLVLDEAAQRLIVIFHPDYNYQSYPVDIGNAAGVLIALPDYNSTTMVKFIDIQDLAAPVEVNTVIHSGLNHSERYVDGALYLVSWNYINDPVEYNSDFWGLVNSYHLAVEQNDTTLAAELKNQITALVRDRVNAAPIESFLPALFNPDSDGTLTPTPAIACEDVYAPSVLIDPRLTTTYKFDADGNLLDALATVITITDAYVSQDNLFIYQSSHNWWWSPDQASETAIHQIEYSSGSLQYRGVGIVAGTLDNRFSMSEHNAHLRVASTETSTQNGTQTTVNHMSVLALGNEGSLALVGSTPEYAQGERIFSARFVGNRGYVVTFRQIDPLFTFDLSVPAAPQLVGELEIPGFSEYIHPIGETRLVTIGQNGDLNGTLPGVRLQLFDVSNLNSPVLLHSYVPPTINGNSNYSWSAANYDHRAFNYVHDLKLLTIPLTIYSSGDVNTDFSGFVSMTVDDAAGFTETGRINHASHLNLVLCVQSPCISDDYYGNDPKRTIVMQDDNQNYLYTLSTRGVIATSTDDPASPIAIINYMEYP